jgi:hypothetical protein
MYMAMYPQQLQLNSTSLHFTSLHSTSVHLNSGKKWYPHKKKKHTCNETNQPKIVKPKIRGHELRRGVKQ